MNLLWKFIDERNWQAGTKYAAVLILLGALSALAGFALWLLISRWALSTPDWMICFIGYPFFVSWIAIVFYSCRHDFHNGSTAAGY